MLIRNAYEDVISFESLRQAEHDVSLGKTNRATVLAYEWNLEDHLFESHDRLERMDFPDIEYKSFMVYEPKPRRIIYTDYNSKIIERALYNYLNPKLSKGLITDTYSCVKGRGQLAAMLRLYAWFQMLARSRETWYYQKLDVRKFFYRIDHDILMNEILPKKISDQRVNDLIGHYICNDKVPFGLRVTDNPQTVKREDMLYDVGIPVGGGLSHTIGNLVLDYAVDQYAKRELGLKYYIRYMDDIIYLGTDKKLMREQKKLIEDRLAAIHLKLNNRCCLRPISNGCEFVGNRIFTDHVILRKSTTLRMKRHLAYKKAQYDAGLISKQKYMDTVQSYKAMLSHVDAKELSRKLWSVYDLPKEGDNPSMNYETLCLEQADMIETLVKQNKCLLQELAQFTEVDTEEKRLEELERSANEPTSITNSADGNLHPDIY